MWSKSSGISLIACLLIWILFGFISPKIATNVANIKNPYPSKFEFNTSIENDKKNGLDGHNPWNEAAKKLEEETLQNYGVESIEELPFNYVGYRMQKGEEKAATDKAVEEIEEKVAEEAEKDEEKNTIPMLDYENMELEALAEELEKLIKDFPVQQLKNCMLPLQDSHTENRLNYRLRLKMLLSSRLIKHQTLR